VLELGAGGGLWTSHLVDALKCRASITAATFNRDLADRAHALELPNTTVKLVERLEDVPSAGFDFVVGTAIVSHDRFEENLEWAAELLRPGGRLLLFEANYSNPQVFTKAKSRRIARWSGNAECQIALRRQSVADAMSRLGFEDLQIVPYDILHPRTPAGALAAVQSAAFVLEHMPFVRDLCGTLFIAAAKPGSSAPPRERPDLARHPSLYGAVSVVVPCHNEAMNIPRLVRSLTASYDRYIHEIVLVNDNSSDETLLVARQMAAEEPRVRVVDRSPPPGVGRALRDGYAHATGAYILTMDCDFEMLVPDLEEMFDAVAAGHEGAMGSRFSRQSVLLNYPAAKLLGNRAFHLLIRIFVRRPVRDISNNLKLYRGDILRDLEITQDGFAANAETGLKPLLAGRDIVEVPMSWINRSEQMGVSTFRVLRVAPGYARALFRMLRGHGRGHGIDAVSEAAPPNRDGGDARALELERR
jgi:SAM-dependent methyltransferase